MCLDITNGYGKDFVRGHVGGLAMILLGKALHLDSVGGFWLIALPCMWWSYRYPRMMKQ